MSLNSPGINKCIDIFEVRTVMHLCWCWLYTCQAINSLDDGVPRSILHLTHLVKVLVDPAAWGTEPGDNSVCYLNLFCADKVNGRKCKEKRPQVH